jgi:2,3-bisphosphoglycerate-independent phosphoglycerate mutase
MYMTTGEHVVPHTVASQRVTPVPLLIFFATVLDQNISIPQYEGEVPLDPS